MHDMMKLLRLLYELIWFFVCFKKGWSFGLTGLGGGGFYNSFGWFLFLIGFELVLYFVAGVGEGFLPGVWVGDVLCEVVTVEWGSCRGCRCSR
jgi:hypothetical protein